MDVPDKKKLAQDIANLQQQLADPLVLRDVQKMKSLTREHDTKEAMLKLVQDHARVQQELSEAAILSTGSDMELRELAAEDQTRLATKKDQLEAAMLTLLLPRDLRDERDVILEIRAGAGGDEASLFAQELFRAYSRFGELHHWTVHIVSSSKTEQGGFKEVIAEISGPAIFGTLKYEQGVHRVQRVPETEKMGRTHTSTVTVAVLPQAEEVDIVLKADDLRIDTYRASGKGGQHVNKTSSAIRITHLPSNTVVAVQDERSQHKNKEKAMRILRSRLLEAKEVAKQKKEAVMRKSQVGTGDRSEKIRTYNFPQDRVTDHRLKKSWSNIPAIMDGQLNAIFNSLQTKARQNAISALA